MLSFVVDYAVIYLYQIGSLGLFSLKSFYLKALHTTCKTGYIHTCILGEDT